MCILLTLNGLEKLYTKFKLKWCKLMLLKSNIKVAVAELKDVINIIDSVRINIFKLTQV
jgi:hypothetical protein